MTDFKRENRYLVIKRKDIELLNNEAQEQLTNILSAIAIAKQPDIDTGASGEIECVVVESDWPEYETVWEMIEKRRFRNNAGYGPEFPLQYVEVPSEEARKIIEDPDNVGYMFSFHPSDLRYMLARDPSSRTPMAINARDFIIYLMDEYRKLYKPSQGMEFLISSEIPEEYTKEGYEALEFTEPSQDIAQQWLNDSRAVEYTIMIDATDPRMILVQHPEENIGYRLSSEFVIQQLLKENKRLYKALAAVGQK